MKNKHPLIISINALNELELLRNNNITEYINLSISNPNMDVINYFLNNPNSYSYSELINKREGYTFVDYETFSSGQRIINDIITNMPTDFNELEKAKYLYCKLGSILKYDINTIPEKNENFSFAMIGPLNNIWGAIISGKGTNVSFTKLYLFLCRLVNIECEIVALNEHGFMGNKITLNIDGERKVIITNITEDLPYIQAKFPTKNFGIYDNDIELDKRIGYITQEYNNNKIDKALRKIKGDEKTILNKVLTVTGNILNIPKIGQIELGIIYENILNNYCPSNYIVINNLFINDMYNKKEHFILISDRENHYSFNYRKGIFSKISSEELQKNINDNNVGVYLGEEINGIITSYNEELV